MAIFNVALAALLLLSAAWNVILCGRVDELANENNYLKLQLERRLK